MGSKSYSKGISWIDDCRIPFVDEKDPSAKRYETPRNSVEGMFNTTVGFKGEYDYKEQTGRFPANLLVCDDMLNDGSISKTNQKEKKINKKHNYNVNFGIGENYNNLNDKGTNSRYYNIDKWFDKIIHE
jgi:hypothetical protein